MTMQPTLSAFETNHYDTFERLYYSLYSNSNTTRSEVILDDLSKLLFLVFLSYKKRDTLSLSDWAASALSAEETLMPLLRQHFPSNYGANDSFSMNDDVLRGAIRVLLSLDLSAASNSILSDAFQALIGPRLRGEKGQFFTPRSLVKAMVQIANPKPTDKIVDPAAGTGGFLIESHCFLREHFGSKITSASLIGIEKDFSLQRLGDAMVSIVTNGQAKLVCSNSLTIHPSNDLGALDPFGADIVLTNPPFGSKIGVTDQNILRRFSLGHIWAYSAREKKWYENTATRKSQDPQILFLELCLHLLRPDGLLGIVLPEGLFGNRSAGYIWDYVRSQAELESMIDCPRTTFQPSTDTKTNVIFLRKRSLPAQENDLVRISVARHCGHDRRGKTQWASGEFVQNDFAMIGGSFASKENEHWVSCPIEDPYYLVPRYYYGRRVCLANRITAKLGGETMSIGQLVQNRVLAVKKGNEVGSEAYGTGGIPFIRTSDINNWEVSLNPTNGVSEEIYAKYRKLQSLRANDILLVADGRYRIGKTAILHEQDCKSIAQSHFRIITVKEVGILDPYELLYILSLPEILDEMRGLIFIQSTLGSLGKRLRELALPIGVRHPQWKENVARFKSALLARSEALQFLRSVAKEDVIL